MPYEEIKIVCVKELLMVLLKKGFARPSYAKFWMTFLESPTFWSSFFQNEIPCLLDTNTRLQLLFLDVNEAGKNKLAREKIVVQNFAIPYRLLASFLSGRRKKKDENRH